MVAPPPQSEAMLPLITIITPSKNRSRLLEDAVLSVLRQHYPRIEHIVMDACSTDETSTVLARFGHLKVIREHDEGSHQAMNAGVQLARGDVIGFLNTDDVYADGIFDTVARQFASDSRLEIVCGAAVRFDRKVANAPAISWHTNHSGDQLYLDLTLGSPCFNAWFFRASTLRRLGPIDTSFDIAGDRELLLRAAQRARIAVVPQIAYGYGVHDEARSLNRAATTVAGIASEHVRMSERYLAQPLLPAAAYGYLRQWHAYEMVRLGFWQIRSGQGPRAWSKRRVSIEPQWVRSLAGAIAFKILLRRKQKRRPSQFADVDISREPIRIHTKATGT